MFSVRKAIGISILFAVGLCLLAMPLQTKADDKFTPVDVDFEESQDLTLSTQALLAERSALLSDVSRQTRWQPHQNIVEIPKDKALWLKFDIANFSSRNKLLTLIAGNTFIDRAEAYLVDEQGRIIQSSRLQTDDSINANLTRHAFKMDLVSRASSTLTVYIQIEDDGLSVVPIELWQSESYAKHSSIKLILLGAFSGGLSLLATYFLFTYILRNAPARFWFCIFTTAAMTTMLSAEGIIPAIFNMQRYAAELTSFGLTITLFAAVKISKLVLTSSAQLWLRMHYVILILPLIGILFLNDLHQLLLLIGLSAGFFLSKLILTLFYRRNIDYRSAVIYFSGWLALGCVGLFEFYTFSANASHLSYSAPLPFALSCLGVMLIGVAIISREQSIQQASNQEHLNKIDLLSQYSDLFEHSAEGLYTATPAGELKHVNPAMCYLFGYESSEELLKHSRTLDKLFANEREYDLLQGELSIQQTVLGKEVRGKRKDNSEFWFSISTQLKKIEGDTLQFGSLFDITERRLHQVNLQYLNTHDQLTGLYNRRHFLQLLNEKIQNQADELGKFALVFIDVDQFKVINDTCGHTAGDVFIKELSLELYDVILDRFPFARLSADQFGVLVDYDNGQALRKFATDLLGKARDFKFKWDRHHFNQSVSIGIAPYTDDVPSAEELLSFADSACLLAKENGRDKIHIYSSELGMHTNYRRELYWVNEVMHALQNENIELFYQHYRPLTAQDKRDYFEILSRLKTKDGDLVAPDFFMPSAEKAHISHKIDKYVIEKLFKWFNSQTSHEQIAKININLSGFSLSDDDFRYFLLNAFEKYQVPYDKICFEITETMAIIKLKEAISFMNEFKKLGCTFALDDFGTGFSSYAYLKSLPVDFLKIDGNFIRDILTDKIDMAMVTSIKDVAEAMQIQTVAEFVETQEIMVQIGKLGVDFAQGFCIAQPTPLREFTSYHQSNLEG